MHQIDYSVFQNSEMSCTPQPQGGLEGDNPPSSPIKTYKLNIHTSQFCTEELVIRSEDFPDVKPGDVLEFYHEEETFSRLLLQVTCHVTFNPVH